MPCRTAALLCKVVGVWSLCCAPPPACVGGVWLQAARLCHSVRRQSIKPACATGWPAHRNRQPAQGHRQRPPISKVRCLGRGARERLLAAPCVFSTVTSGVGSMSCNRAHVDRSRYLSSHPSDVVIATPDRTAASSLDWLAAGDSPPWRNKAYPSVIIHLALPPDVRTISHHSGRRSGGHHPSALLA